MKVSFSREALGDARAAADWYIDQGAWPAALKLKTQIEASLQTLLRNPALGTPGPAGTRIMPLQRFPVSLVYRLEGEHIRVIAVAAQRRQASYWASRK